MAWGNNPVGLITGVTGGMGEAIMFALLAQGFSIALIGRNAVTIGHIINNAEAQGYSGKITMHLADLGSEEQTRQAVAAALTHHSHIDCFIHSAGIIEEAPLEKITYEQMERLYRVNTLSPMVICQELTATLEARQGQVVFINSSSVQTVRATKTPYTVTKTALKALADSIRAEFNPKGIRTVSIFPGRTGTDLQRRLHEGRNETFEPEYFIQPADVANLVLHLIQMPRTAEVTEVFLRPMKNWMKPGAGL
jgi:NADP-dependent 3-hydroxy acid dehydrogenase YdfG